MRTICEEFIKAPVEEVFSWLDDDAKRIKWSGQELPQYTTPQNPSNPVGTRFKQMIKEGNRMVEYQGEILAYQKPHLMGVRLGNAHFSMDIHYKLSPENNGTRIECVSEAQFANGFFKLMAKAFGWFTKLIMKQQFKKLKKHVEA